MSYIQVQGEEYLSGHHNAQHGEGDVLSGQESEGFMHENAVEGSGDVEQFDHGKQGDVSKSAMQKRGKDAAPSTVQALSFKKDMKDTELGSLRILEKDVMDKAISKAIFKRRKSMATKGNFYYR